MKLIIIRALIGWLWRNHKWLLVEQVVGPEAHIHRNPRPKKIGRPPEMIPIPDGPNPATGGVDS